MKYKVTVRYLMEKTMIIDGAADEADAEDEAMIIFDDFKGDGEYTTSIKEIKEEG